MPELPEVETIRLQLTQVLSQKKIAKIQILKGKSFIGDKNLVIGKTVKSFRRFAKILVIDLSDGLSLAIHLKMSGQLLYQAKSEKRKAKSLESINLPDKYTRVIINFTGGDQLFFNDMRIFGWIKVFSKKDLEDVTNIFGPDALKELNDEEFYKILKISKRPIKLVLMDQEKLAGVGNIYANDALFLTKINPNMRANNLSQNQANKLLRNLQKVLNDGIRWKGASRNSFRDIYGRKGEAQDHFYVYSRDGEMCFNNCGGQIRKFKLGGRGTFFCPNCQSS